MASKYKIDDRVLYNGKVGEIDNIGYSDNNEEYHYIVRFENGKKKKALESEITPAGGEDVKITATQFDEAVKAYMYSVAEDVGDTDQLDGALEIVGIVCRQLKTRLFERND